MPFTKFLKKNGLTSIQTEQCLLKLKTVLSLLRYKLVDEDLSIGIHKDKNTGIIMRKHYHI